MNILRRKYIQCFVRFFHFKFIYFLIIYKLIFKFNYSYFFYFKNLLIESIYYRFYLLNASFKFLFLDYIYFIGYLNYINKLRSSRFSLPIQFKSYSVLRSPFVYSKSREHFVVNYYCLFFNIKPSIKSLFYFNFLDTVLKRIRLDSSKF